MALRLIFISFLSCVWFACCETPVARVFYVFLRRAAHALPQSSSTSGVTDFTDQGDAVKMCGAHRANTSTWLVLYCGANATIERVSEHSFYSQACADVALGRKVRWTYLYLIIYGTTAFCGKCSPKVCFRCCEYAEVGRGIKKTTCSRYVP